VLRQRHELRLDWPMTTTFSALVNVLAKGRWARELSLDPPGSLPRAGARYEQQRGQVLRCGRVLECIKPLSITLHETLFDPPCRVQLRLRWRLEPVETGCLLRLDAAFELNGAASLRRRHWSARIEGHCGRMLLALQDCVAAIGAAQGAAIGVSGQSIGSSSMTTAKISSVSGTPSFRKSTKR